MLSGVSSEILWNHLSAIRDRTYPELPRELDVRKG